ncbi:hypothetical protein ACPV47_24985 [Vibrio jasicida]|uniref:hypothetical protein n=1 Tax=Vibrio jasicida TaxID=766224 RepID=UPI0040687850
MEEKDRKELIDDVIHRVQARAIIIGVPALLAVFFTMWSLLSTAQKGPQGDIGPKGDVGPQGPVGQVGTVPSGAVIPFDLSKCPEGWTEYALAYGRFIRGIDRSGANIDPDGERTLGDTQDDAIQVHTHERPYRIGGNASGGGRNMEDNSANSTLKVGEPVGARVSSETRPKNVSLLYCRKT